MIRPALSAPRGEPRIQAFFMNWMAWEDDPEMPGGCLLVAASVELDDRPGPQRDFLVQAHRDRFRFMVKAARMAVEAGHFRADLGRRAARLREMNSLALGYHHSHRLLRDERAGLHARAALERLLADCRNP